MKGWIEVTDVCEKEPFLINLRHVEYVNQDGIIYCVDGEFTVKETYEELKTKIMEAQDD